MAGKILKDSPKGRVLRKALSAALTLVLALALTVTPGARALAEDTAASQKTYKVRIYSGQWGLIKDADGNLSTVFEQEFPADNNKKGRVSFYPDTVSLQSDKYYVKGIRESGKDIKEDNPSFEVDRDIDYVVSYGIRGASTPYTVSYHDRDGNELLPSETLYGNVGDQPIVSYRYIEGWLPQAYNLTRTLSDNGAENVFDFVYTQVTEGGAAGGTGETPEAGEAGTGTEEATAAGAEGAAGAAGAGAAGAGEAGAAGGEAVPDENTPQDLINLDDEETPLANFSEGLKNLFNPEGNGSLINIPKPLVAAALAALLIPCIVLLVRRKKKKEIEADE